MRLVLASASPRRRELLVHMGLDFDIMPSMYDEHIDIYNEPYSQVVNLAYNKAMDVVHRVKEPFIVIGADTIVVKNGIFGKPKNEDDAYRMLKSLQGSMHEVITGLAIINTTDNRCMTSYESTLVEMAPLTDEQIMWYISTKEPMDKAGGYAIQGLGAAFIKGIKGCYYNAVGLPIHRLWSMLDEFGINVMHNTK